MKCAILISLYNAEKTLNKTFESLKAQTFQDFRIIAINDCSTDRTLDFLKKWQEKFGKEKFTLINNEQDIGLTKSLNKGLSQITELYTARIDADDWWDATKIGKQIQFLENHLDYGVIGSNYSNISHSKDIPIHLPESDEEIRKTIFRRNPFAHSAVVFRTNIVKACGKYDEKSYYGQDYELWLRLLPQTKFYNLQETLCFRTLDGTLSTKKQREQMLQAIKTRLRYLKKYKRPLLEYCYIYDLLIIALLPEWLRTLKRSYWN